MRTRFVACLCTVAVLAGCLFALQGRAVTDANAQSGVTITWTGAAGTTDWGAPGNWNLDRVPVSTDNVSIPSGDNVTISSGTQSANWLDSSGNLTLSGGALTLAQASTMGPFTFTGGALEGSGNVTINGLFTWTGGNMTGSGATTANGGINLSGYPTLDRTLNNAANGTATYSGSPSSFTINYPGVFNNQAGATFNYVGDAPIDDYSGTGPSFQNYGVFNRVSADNGVAQIYGAMSNNGGTVNIEGGTLDVSGTYTQQYGATTVSGGTLDVFGTYTQQDGTTTVKGGTLDVFGTYTQQDGTTTVKGGTLDVGTYEQQDGTTTVDGGSLSGSTVGITGGWLFGVGSVTGAVSTYGTTGVIPGSVAPAVPGILTISGSYSQAADAALAIYIGGTTPGNGAGDYSQLNVSGSANLTGTLNVDLVNGFTPSAGDTFTILTASNVTGAFATTNLPALSGGFAWNITYHPTSVVLTVGKADLSLTDTSSPNPVVVGRNLTYTLGVTNNGPDPADNAVVSDNMSSNVTFVSANCTQGTAVQSGSTVTFDLGNLASGAKATATVVVTPNMEGSVVNTATVASDTLDPYSGNNTATATTQVNPSYTTITWTGDAGTTDWGTALNWNLDRVPVSTDNVSIPSGDNVTISSGSQSANWLYSSGNLTLSGGSLTLAQSSTMGLLTFTGGALEGSGNVAINGLFTWTGGAMSGSGATTANGGMSLSGSPTLSRTLNNAGGGTATYSGSAAGTFLINGVFNNQAGATFNYVGESPTTYNAPNQNVYYNYGDFNVSASNGEAYIVGGMINNGGTVDFESGTTMEMANNYEQDQGTTNLDGGSLSSPSVEINSGELCGVGSVSGAVSTSNAAVSPGLGSTPGIVSISGSYSQTKSVSLNVYIGGTAPGNNADDYSQLEVSGSPGSATLSGTLDVALVSSFSPSADDNFTIVKASSVTGTFATTNLPALSGGLIWNITYNPTSVVLSVTTRPEADLAVTDTGSPNPVTAGSNLIYTLGVTNHGPDSAANVVLSDNLSANVTFVSANCTQGTPVQSGSTVTFNLGSLASGANATATVVVTPTAPGTIVNTAGVTSDTFDPYTANNTATATTQVKPPVSVTTASLASGETGVSYSQTLTASGGVAPYTWSIAGGTLPPGLSLDASSGLLSGTPTAPGTYSPVFKATDSTGASITMSIAIIVNVYQPGGAVYYNPAPAPTTSPAAVPTTSPAPSPTPAPAPATTAPTTTPAPASSPTSAPPPATQPLATTIPTPPTSIYNPPPPTPKSGIAGALLFGIIAAGVILAGILIFLLLVMARRRRK